MAHGYQMVHIRPLLTIIDI